MTTQEKLNLLQEIVGDAPEMDSILDKIVLLQREAYRLRLQRYDYDLTLFEERYKMDSDIFYERFTQGSLGDGMVFLRGLDCLSCTRMFTIKCTDWYTCNATSHRLSRFCQV